MLLSLKKKIVFKNQLKTMRRRVKMKNYQKFVKKFDHEYDRHVQVQINILFIFFELGDEG